MIRTFPPHADPVQAYLLGRADEGRERDEEDARRAAERPRYERELDRILDRIWDVEPSPRWVADDLLVIADAVGVLDVAA